MICTDALEQARNGYGSIPSGEEVMTRIPRWLFKIRTFCLCVPLLIPVGAALGQEKEVPEKVEEKVVVEETTTEAYNIWTTKRLTGDWGGTRTALEDAGFKFTLAMGTTTSVNFMGGQNTHNSFNNAGRGFYIFEFDLEKMGLIPGGSIWMRMLQDWNDGIGADVGSRGAPYWAIGSGGDNSFSQDKWWYKQMLFDGKFEFRLGKMLNVVDLFDKNEYADNYATKFSNQHLNYNATIPVVTGLGAYAKVMPTDWLYIQGGAFDTDFNQTSCSHGWNGFDVAFEDDANFMGMVEAGVKTEFAGMTGNVRLGGWYDPRTKTVYHDTLGGLRATKTQRGDIGFYMNFDQLVYKENDDPKDKQGLGIFGRYGYAHGDVNAVSHAWSLGASYLGLVPERDKDVFAFGIAQNIMSKDMRRETNSLADRETIYELYYAIKLTPWCTITPDLQVITNPGGNKDAHDAFIGGVRIMIVF